MTVTAAAPGSPSGARSGADVIGGKWKVLILWALSVEPRRFGELKRAVEGISEKVLIQQVRELERDGIVHREVHEQVPPKVVYSLTPLGIALDEALEPLGRWGDVHMAHIAATRSAT